MTLTRRQLNLVLKILSQEWKRKHQLRVLATDTGCKRCDIEILEMEMDDLAMIMAEVEDYRDIEVRKCAI